MAGRAEGVGDLGRRGAHYGAADDTILFQSTKLRGESFFAHASENIAEFGETQRTKGKAAHRLDFPLAAGGRGWSLEPDSRGEPSSEGPELTNLCVLHRTTGLLYHVLDVCGSQESA